MNSNEKRCKREITEQAKAYLVIKRGYKTPQEKKAFKIAERLRRRDWEESISALPEEERRARLRAFGAFKRQVFLRGLVPAKRRKSGKAAAQPDGSADAEVTA